MKNKTSFGILVGALAIGIGYLYKKQKCKQKNEYYYKQAIHNMNNKNYETSLYFFEKINKKTENILQNMAECYFLIKDYKKAIEAIDVCLSNNLNVEMLEKKYILKKKNRELASSFKDVFLLNLLTQKYREETTFLLKKISEKRAKGYKIRGWASKICFKEFFDTICFLDELDSPVAVFIKSEEYLKCYNYVKDRDGEVELFIKGCIKMINGDWAGAMDAFMEKEYIYSKLMGYWLQTRRNAENMGVYNKKIIKNIDQFKQGKTVPVELEKKQSKTEQAANKIVEDMKSSKEKKGSNVLEEDSLEDLVLEDGSINIEESFKEKQENLFDRTVLEEFSENKNPTVLFYLAKIYENLNETELQMKYMKKSLDVKRTGYGVGYNLVCMIKQQEHKDIENAIEKAVEEFREDINIYCIAIEYFIIIKKVNKAKKILACLESMDLKDPRIFILKFLVAKLQEDIKSESLKENNIVEPFCGSQNLKEASLLCKTEYLKKAIRIDPLYLKSYVFLGKEQIEMQEAVKILDDALICAKTFDELYIVYQLLTIAETHQELRKLYPNLF